MGLTIKDFKNYYKKYKELSTIHKEIFGLGNNPIIPSLIHISKIYRDAIPQMKVLFHLEGVCTFRMKVQESMKNFSAPKELVLL
ncbi:hypothetical protein [Lysinibacillus capsici]|uniref:hypothetical protein n=1 Tax=Lysinibacillus capsici TaxID=2115968 RepID=UPI0034E49A11